MKDQKLVLIPSYGEEIPKVIVNNMAENPINKLNTNDTITSEEYREVGYSTYNIYLLSDNKIKKDDIYYDMNLKGLFKAESDIEVQLDNYKKVIASTKNDPKFSKISNNIILEYLKTN